MSAHQQLTIPHQQHRVAEKIPIYSLGSRKTPVSLEHKWQHFFVIWLYILLPTFTWSGLQGIFYILRHCSACVVTALYCILATSKANRFIYLHIYLPPYICILYFYFSLSIYIHFSPGMVNPVLIQLWQDVAVPRGLFQGRLCMSCMVTRGVTKL
jgi:hypothetical protein